MKKQNSHSISGSTDLEHIDAEIESLRKQLTNTSLSSKKRTGCEEKLREWNYDRKTFIQNNPTEDKPCVVNQIDTGSFVKCLIENAIKGSIQYVLQIKQKETPSPEFEQDMLWVSYSGKKITNLLTFEQCCLFSGQNFENIRYAIYRISRLPIEKIKEIIVKFKTKQERKYTEPEEKQEFIVNDFCLPSYEYETTERFQRKLIRKFYLKDSDQEEVCSYISKNILGVEIK